MQKCNTCNLLYDVIFKVQLTLYNMSPIKQYRTGAVVAT